MGAKYVPPRQRQQRQTGTKDVKEVLPVLTQEEIEKANQRSLRFKKDQKKFEKEKKYGFISRGEDDRLQRSSKEREAYFNTILSTFIQYCNSNTTSTLNEKIESFLDEKDLKSASAEADTQKHEPGNSSITIDSILSSLRKLREALLFAPPNDFSKKVFLFSIRLAASIGYHQTYIPCIMNLLSQYNTEITETRKNSTPELSGSHSYSITKEEVEEIATLLVLHVAHFNKDNARSIRLYFEYLSTINSSSSSKTYEIWRSWVHKDYYNWIRLYNAESDNARSTIMNFGLNDMVRQFIDCTNKSYFNLPFAELEQNMLPNGVTYDTLVNKYNVSWKREDSNLIIRARKTAASQ
ncbi:uncharacterized protein RJT20DRAFT_98561 [Scheffersomyces xylosifermentans]|uniref:uncharacterized protein n=1 Tax=Scheffersomyces xylosifermentans TaxID=1304137 RepID=UPI00315D9FDA